VLVEILFNQASKQPGTINTVIKMQRILFHKIHDYSLLFMLIKMSVQKETIFPKQNLELLLEPFTLKTYKNRRSLHRQTQE
jgi:hypothetical protein